jgi:arylsulfatase A-like enzyme
LPTRRQFLAAAAPLAAQDRKPNFVIITADNLGYGDLRCFGNPDVLTPNLDRFARQGTRFTNFYTASPSCTPSRAGLLTGRHPLRYGLNYQLNQEENQRGIGLPHGERLLPYYLKEMGYRTGCFGKWNLGFGPGSRPTERGFDEFVGMRSGFMDYFTHRSRTEHDVFRGTEPYQSSKYSTDLFADAACDFIRASARQPFFLYLPFNAVHYNNQVNARPGETLEQWDAPDRYFQMYGWDRAIKDQKKRYKAVITAMDGAFGRLMRQLDQLNLTGNTFVVFFSDNGAFLLENRGLEVASNRPLRGGGVSCQEGGIRVAAMARWPGRIKPASACGEMLSSMDLLPTLLSNAGSGLPENLDGRDATAAVTGEGGSPHDGLYFEWKQGGVLQQAMRRKQWKLLRDAGQPWKLYDLERDLGETENIAAAHPQITIQLAAMFETWRKTVPS